MPYPMNDTHDDHSSERRDDIKCQAAVGIKWADVTYLQFEDPEFEQLIHISGSLQLKRHQLNLVNEWQYHHREHLEKVW